MSAVLESRQSMHYTPERQNLSLFDCIIPVTAKVASEAILGQSCSSYMVTVFLDAIHYMNLLSAKPADIKINFNERRYYG